MGTWQNKKNVFFISWGLERDNTLCWYIWTVPLSCTSHLKNSLKSLWNAFTADITLRKIQINSPQPHPSIFKSTSISKAKNCGGVLGAIFFISLTFPSEWIFQLFHTCLQGSRCNLAQAATAGGTAAPKS